MAKPYEELTKTMFRENYNVVKVLTNKVDIMKQLETFNPNNQAVAFATKKQQGSSLEERVFSLEEKFDLIMKEIKSIKTEMRNGLQKINDRLDNIVKKNNLIE